MFYSSPDAVIKAKQSAEKLRQQIEKEHQAISNEIEKLENEQAENISTADFDTFKKASETIASLKEKMRFYENCLSEYADGNYPQISPKDICNSWNKVSEDVSKKIEKSFESVSKARAEFIKAIESYASVVADGLKIYYGYRTQLPRSAFNRLDEPIFQFNELPKHPYSKIADITGFIYNSDLIKHRYLTRILDRGIYWTEE